MGIITSGIDYRDSAFRYSNGDTRILRIWDQTNNQGNRPGQRVDHDSPSAAGGEWKAAVC